MILRVLAFHARSEAQLRVRLAKGGFQAEVDEAIAWARRLGYLDDAAYARGRARWLLGPGGVGPRRALERLRAAGIDSSAAQAAVAEATEDRAGPHRGGDSAEVALARAALARKLRGRAIGDLDERGRARLARFLLGRGFSPAAVLRLVPVRGDGD